MNEAPSPPSSGHSPSSAHPMRLDVLKALGDNTRYAIYLELARSASPLTTADIASTLKLHPNTVRPHLERMRDVGLIEVSVDGRGAVGRPQHRYQLSADAPSLGFEPPVMPMLAQMVTRLAARLGASAGDAHEIGCDEGLRRAERSRPQRSALEALVGELDQLGFDPVVSADSDDSDIALIAFANCPFGQIAGEHPDLVCALHRGMVDGFTERLGEVEITAFASLADRAPCQMSARMAEPTPRPRNIRGHDRLTTSAASAPHSKERT